MKMVKDEKQNYGECIAAIKVCFAPRLAPSFAKQKRCSCSAFQELL
jgi:hypothetical protein